MAFELPDLPYAHDALASNGMSQETMEYHHDIHHKAYVDNGKKLISGTEWEGKSLEDIITGNYKAGEVAQNGIFNNASQHWNHMQFWEMMGPGDAGMPGELEKAITDAFGSVDKFKEEFSAAGAGQFGSGWAWLVKDEGGAQGDEDRERREPPLLRPDSASRLRRVGAFLLHRLPQQAPGLPQELPRQSRELGERRQSHVTAARAASGRRQVFGPR